MADWPFACPTAWQETPGNVLLRSEVEAGIPKQRRRWTRAARQVSAQFALTPRGQAYIDLMQFFDIDCQQGAVPFTMHHPYAQDTRTYRWRAPPVISDAENIVLMVSAELEEI